jgi:choice-of-anchor A domain-containing protein
MRSTRSCGSRRLDLERLEDRVLLDSSLGVAGDFNVFVFDRITQTHSDTQGRVAAGGDASFLHYGLGSGLANSAGERDDLVVGGHLTFHHGQVHHGNVVHGGTGVLANFGLPNGTARQGRPVNFDAARTELSGLSAAWGALAPNGTTADHWGTLNLTGHDASLNVFTIPAEQLGRAVGFNVSAPAGSTVLVNVSGTAGRMQNFGMNVLGTDRQHVLFNFTAATTLTLGAISVQGSVLAPFADVSFDNGNLEGTLIARSMTGTGEFHHFPPQVELPSSPTNDPPRAQIDIQNHVAEYCVQGGEGLTPGYWKQDHHLETWVPTGYRPEQRYNAVFGVNDPGNPTLLEALGRNGGGFNALGRHAAAALLNAAHPFVEYSFTVTQVLTKVRGAYANPATVEAVKDQLARENERGADLSTGDGPNGPSSDADDAPGLVVRNGRQVTFSYVVTNPGQVALANVVVTDDNQTPGNASDDFNPAPVLSGGFNVGDTDRDGELDVGEEWEFTSGPIDVEHGQHTAVTRVTARRSGGEDSVTDDDAVNWLGVLEEAPLTASLASLTSEGLERQRFVQQVYRDVLAREAEAGGLEAWIGFLEIDRDPSGAPIDTAVRRGQLVQAVQASPEARTRALDLVYRNYLGRTIDPSGRDAWLGFLNGGGTLHQVARYVLESPEFSQQWGGTNQAFLDAVYAAALGRAIDASGQAAFTAALEQGLSRQTVVGIILGSLEAHQRTIQDFYRQLLRREADAGGLSAFAAASAGGMSGEHIAALIVSSPEYLARARANRTA